MPHDPHEARDRQSAPGGGLDAEPAEVGEPRHKSGILTTAARPPIASCPTAGIRPTRTTCPPKASAAWRSRISVCKMSAVRSPPKKGATGWFGAGCRVKRRAWTRTRSFTPTAALTGTPP
jgi:hypothetical protein